MVDNSIGVSPQRVAEALRARGINARSVDEIFGLDPGDPAIMEVLEALNGRIVASDRGAVPGTGFWNLRIKVPQRLRTVDEVVRLVESQLPNP